MRTIFGLFSEFSDQLVKIAFYTSTGTNWAEVMFFSKELLFFYHFRTLNKLSFGLLAVVFRQSYPNCVLLVHGNFFRRYKCFFMEGRIFIYLSRTLSIFFFFSNVFRRRCQSCIPRVQRDNLRKIIFFDEIIFVFFFHFWALRKKNSDFRLKVFRQVYQNCSLRVCRILLMRDATFSEIHFFPITDNEQNTFSLPAIFFRQGHQNCILRVHRKIFWRNSIFLKNLNFYTFWILSEYFSVFCRKIFDGDVKTAF